MCVLITSGGGCPGEGLDIQGVKSATYVATGKPSSVLGTDDILTLQVKLNELILSLE